MTNTSKYKASSDRPDGVRVTAAKCVRCKAPVTPRLRPFCSQRCSDIDLAGWLTGQYRIPTEEQVESGDLNVELDED
ncbi:MAG: DNA gyrase inhibitor YacG [Rhodospirillaceae bacterium]